MCWQSSLPIAKDREGGVSLSRAAALKSKRNTLIKYDAVRGKLRLSFPLSGYISFIMYCLPDKSADVGLLIRRVVRQESPGF